MDTTQNITYTVDISDTDLKDLVIETDKNFDFSHLLPKK
jgi:cytidylate kinase